MKRLLIALATILFLTYDIQANTDLIDPNKIFHIREDSNFTFSPNGKYIAYTKKVRSSSYLHVLDIKKREIAHKVELNEGSPTNLSWLSNRRVMYEYYGRLLAMNVDGSEHRVLIDHVEDYDKIKSYYALKKQFRTWDILHTLPDNDEVILLQSKNRKGIASVEKVNIFTGKRETIASGKSLKITSWHTDILGNVIMGLSHKKGVTSVHLIDNNTPNENDIHKKPSLKEATKIDISAESYFNTKMKIQSGSFDTDIIYISDSTNSDTFNLSTYSISERKIIDRILEDTRYDIGTINNKINLHFHESEAKLVGVTYKSSKIKSVWFDENFKKVQDKIDANYQNTNNHISSWTEDLSTFLVYMESSTNLGKIYVYEYKSNKMIKLADYSSVLEEQILPEMKAVSYKSKDGTEHESYLTLPLNYTKNHKIPFVIQVHGGPWARYVWGYDPESAYFSSRGYGVLRVNFRGSTGYGRNYMRAGTKNISTVMIDDIADATKWAISENMADPKRIYIMGTSYGGYAALVSLARYPNLYAAASSLAAPLDIITQIKDYKKKDYYFAYDYWSFAVGDLKKDKKRLKEISPINLIKEIRAPYQIFHGEHDDTVDVKQVKAFEKEMNKSKSTNKIRIIKDEGHGLYHQSNRVYYIESAEKLFSSSSL